MKVRSERRKYRENVTKWGREKGKGKEIKIGG